MRVKLIDKNILQLIDTNRIVFKYQHNYNCEFSFFGEKEGLEALKKTKNHERKNVCTTSTIITREKNDGTTSNIRQLLKQEKPNLAKPTIVNVIAYNGYDIL